ncbi:leucine--tRNA ligase [Halocatena halophila]|uniref:leucine--tRNA ligase n=1 Tax=Halocatena halophila TaxID=2814576 RepID=UPI002ED011FB
MNTQTDPPERFDHAAIERRAQQQWADADVFRIDDETTDPTYVLSMFPYTSGTLHMGHVRNYTLTDAYARFERLRGASVLHPIGWDAFGLPAENAAKKQDTNPRDYTLECIETMAEQMRAMGFGYDWDREITTCEPEYYQWNQWLFTQFYETGLLERQETELNWCPSCETVLADEQVEGDEERCWRCGTPIESREMDQWFFTITEYADELLEAIDTLDGWPENVKEMQRNWIGRQAGYGLSFEIPALNGSVDVFTTRLDTIYGATFLALSPGHPLSERLGARNEAVQEYLDYVESVEQPPQESGVDTGVTTTNPATGEEIPVYVADYVLDDVGTGALFGVPAHDDRDHAFATEHDIPIRQVVEPADDRSVDTDTEAFTEDGILINSAEFDGLTSETARERFLSVFEAETETTYRLRDWGISRQRYWGTPIPMIHCDDCGYQPVPADDLPVELPEFINTTGNPLDAATDWKQVSCPSCGSAALRETDTMDTFVDSSWYFLRFISPELESAPFDTEQASDWLPVDRYVGGSEHAVMHLLYARFFTKVLSDLELLEGVREPFTKLTTQGMVLGEDGAKMSKSRGNGVSPQRIVEEYGADTARLFTMEAALPERDFEWSPDGVAAASGFLQRVYSLAERIRTLEDPATVDADATAYVTAEIDRTVETVTESYEAFTFNRALSELRELIGLLGRYLEYDGADPATLADGIEAAVTMLSPVAPHVTEAIWERLDTDGLLATAEWPAGSVEETYHLEERLIENTRADVRDIIDTAGIDDPREITLTVAPEWKHHAYQLAAGADGNVVGTVMADEQLRERGEQAASFAKEIAGGATEHQLHPDRERAALERAAWLLEDEFGAPVEIRPAEDDERTPAQPGRVAIDITE